MHTTIKFAKVKPNAIIPTKRKEDAGYDIYACFDEDYIIIPAHTTVMIPTGIASVCSNDYCFVLKERGSTGIKGMAQRAGVIDSGFRGEWQVPITNTNDVPVLITKNNTTVYAFGKKGEYIKYPYEKAIAQALLVPVPTAEVEEISYEELKAIPSDRRCGSLGSSGK